MVINEPNRWEKIKGGLFHFLPHHLISRFILWITRLEVFGVHRVIALFVRVFKVELDEAEKSDIKNYSNFNAFFTRALKAEARPIHQEPNSVVSPCDGTVVQIGKIESGRIIQAKRLDYSVNELLTARASADFGSGYFCTLYLGPHQYHRVHAPLAGQLEQMIHVPGRLFSVAPYATQLIPRLYTKNERVISIFNTAYGRVAVVMVGALNVSAIETVWHGLVSPKSYAIAYYDYQNNAPDSKPRDVELNKGAELGRFNLGSTVVLLVANETLSWNPRYCLGAPVKVGCELASFIQPETPKSEQATVPPSSPVSNVQQTK